MGKRIDAEDTVDVATNFLHRWQAEGFGVEDVECHVEYVPIGGRKLPIEVVVTIRLTPARER